MKKESTNSSNIILRPSYLKYDFEVVKKIYEKEIFEHKKYLINVGQFIIHCKYEHSENSCY